MSLESNSGNKKIICVNDQEIVFPARTARLLFFSDSDPRNSNFGLSIKISVDILNGEIKSEEMPRDDPSTIFTKMPLQKPTFINDIPHPSYFPTYAGLTPDQKWIYLNWLRDITQPIPIGYVFIYYYGLERHLMIGDYELAFEEILLLREHHHNNSFIIYSTNALRYSSLFNNRMDLLEHLYKSRNLERFDNFDLLITQRLGYDLSANIIIKLADNIKGVNRRYLKRNPDLFTKNLEEFLTRTFGGKYFPFSSKYNISSLPKCREGTFANFTFPSNIRTVEIPNFFEYKPFVDDISEILSQVHELTKKEIHDSK
jgi:hypothetical protein